MASKAKIKKDELGLYISAGGWISRPFFGTIFKEGDTVKSHHFGGSTLVGVIPLDVDKEVFNFKRNGKHEHWNTTGIMTYEYKDMDVRTIVDSTRWYKEHVGVAETRIYTEMNKEFEEIMKEIKETE